MNKVALLATTVLFAGATHAAEISNVITDSVKLSVTPQVQITTPTSATYSVSGTNISVTTMGGVSTSGAYDTYDKGGQAFSLSESKAAAGSIVQTQSAGVAGSLAGTLSNTGVGTVTAGGAGSEALLQRSIELTVFK